MSKTPNIWLFARTIDLEPKAIALNQAAREAMLVARAAAPESYSGTYEFQPSDCQFRSQLRTEKPRIYGACVGQVVGDGEINTEPNGQVQVQFFWDTMQQSYWARVVQPWAGNQWGTQFIPRVGMEVLVEFEQGDPDHPVVVGCLYNGNNDFPYSLPGNKTQSGVKTNSSTGGGGYNELMFDDQKGSEQVRFHAQKDLDSVIENNETRKVGNNQTETIQNSRSATDHDGRYVDDRHGRSVTIGTNDSLTVGADRTVTVGANRTAIVGVAETVMADATVTIVCGASSIIISPGSIIITSPSILLNGPPPCLVQASLALRLCRSSRDSVMALPRFATARELVEAFPYARYEIQTAPTEQPPVEFIHRWRRRQLSGRDILLRLSVASTRSRMVGLPKRSRQ